MKNVFAELDKHNQGGRGKPDRLEDGTRLKGDAWELCRRRGHVTPAMRASRPEVPSSRRDVLDPHSPALKGGVTTNSALQAGCIFLMCDEDKTGRGCCLPC